MQALGFPGRPAAPVITLEDSDITANLSECVTDTSDNGLYIENTVCQASGLWQIHSSVETSGIGKGVYVKNLYSESTLAMIPPCTGSCPMGATSPFRARALPGCSWARRLPAGSRNLRDPLRPKVLPDGWDRRNAAGILDRRQRCDRGNTHFAHADSGLEFDGNRFPDRELAARRERGGCDHLRHHPSHEAGKPRRYFPYNGGCTGGAGGICGSVATGLAQASVCTINGGLVCTFTDTASASTSAYTINSGSYGGTFSFWPGSLVSNGQTLATNVEIRNVTAINAAGQPDSSRPDVNVNCQTTAGGGYTACLVAQLSSGGKIPT